MAGGSLVLPLRTEPPSSLHKIVFSFSCRSVVFIYIYIYIYIPGELDLVRQLCRGENGFREAGEFFLVFFFSPSLLNTEAILSLRCLSCFVTAVLDDGPKHAAFDALITL